MKSIHIVLIGVIFICACHRHTVSQTSNSVNHEEIDSHGNVMLLGKATKERLQQAPFGEWFNKNYADYKIDSSTADKLKPLTGDKHFLLFMGTWCGDSKREIPRVFKLLNYLGVKPSQVELVTVDNIDSAYKQSPTHEERGLNIHHVPDLVIYNGKVEMGRVIESPVMSWEKDMLTILQAQSYTPNYKVIERLDKIFSTTGVQSVGDNLQTVADQLKPLAENRYELNTYAHVLMAAHETTKALTVYQLNTFLFSTDPGTWVSLANALVKTGDKKLAKHYYEKALSLEPENEDVKKLMKEL